MGYFETEELCTTFKNGSDKVRIVTKKLVFISDLVGRIEIPEGFETDFASVPRVPFIYWFWGNRAHREAVLHDYLFRKDSNPLVSYSMANKVFLEAMAARDKNFAIRYPMYAGVCVGSFRSFHKKTVDYKFPVKEKKK